jgi:hypothetical protein
MDLMVLDLRKNHVLSKSAIRNPVAVSLLIVLVMLMLAGEGARAGSAAPKVVILEFHGMKQGILDENL